MIQGVGEFTVSIWQMGELRLRPLDAKLHGFAPKSVPIWVPGSSTVLTAELAPGHRG